MCGIAGIVGQAPLPDLEVPLRRMQAALRHRGPDDAGIFIAPGRNAGFAHTRLSIIDLSPAGHQPMSTPDGRFTIVFNGEIYNFRELRRELMAGGVAFRSSSDTEVLLRMYERFGIRFVEQLRGMFALAIWDEREGQCLLARDPLGIKPLYLRVQGRGAGCELAFASEVRALVAGGVAEAEVDPEALMGYLRTGSVPEPLTILRGVECLSAGTILVWRAGRVQRLTYWELPLDQSPPDPLQRGGRADLVSHLREGLLDSVRAHHVSDVPVGIFLSGGIDSTALLALSRAIGQRDIRTFSISFAETSYQEGPAARRTAEAFGTDHYEWSPSAAEAGVLLDAYWPSLDQPTVDGFNTWCVSRAARSHGMKVVLSGLGGDEFFGGYPSFTSAPLLAKAGYVPRALRAPIGAVLQRYSTRPPRRKIGEFLQGAAGLNEAWGAVHAIFTWDKAAVLGEWLTGVPAPRLLAAATASTQLVRREHPLSHISALEVTQYMRNQLLRDSDVMSMAWGLELRVPLVDSHLAELVCQFPPAERLHVGKRLLVDAVPEIPDWILSRPKAGFQFPFPEWVRGAWADRFRAATGESPVLLQTWYQQWAVLAFHEWWRNVRDVVSGRVAA